MIQGSGRAGPRIERLDRHRRPTHKRRGLHPVEETGVCGCGWVWGPRTDRTGDGYRGDDGDERHTRDDLIQVHV